MRISIPQEIPNTIPQENPDFIDTDPAESSQKIPVFIRNNFKQNITSSELIWGQCALKENEKPMKKRIFAVSTQKICIFAGETLRWGLPIKDLSEVYLSLFYSDILLVWNKHCKAVIIDTYLDNRKEIMKKIHWTNKIVKIKMVSGTFLQIQQTKVLQDFNQEEVPILDSEYFEQVDSGSESFMAQLRFINSSKSINVEQMRKKYEQTQEQIGTMNKLDQYDILGELLANDFWCSYMAHRKSQSLKKQTGSKNLVSSLLTLKLYDKSALTKDVGLLNFAIKECLNLQKAMTPYVPTLRKVFTTETELVLILDFYQGLLLSELFHAAKSQKKEYSILKPLLGEIVVALGHLHECGINYGEMSSKNILVNHDGHTLLVDLGTCCKPGDPVVKPANSYCPEEATLKISSKGSDWWLLGALICELTGKPLFVSLSQETVFAMLTSKHQLNVQLSDKTEPPLADLAQALLKKDPQLRLGYKNDYHEVLAHPFFKGVDKKGLMARAGPPIKKLKIKAGTQVKRGSAGSKEIDRQLEQCIYSRDLQ